MPNHITFLTFHKILSIWRIFACFYFYAKASLCQQIGKAFIQISLPPLLLVQHKNKHMYPHVSP